jgi:hypothetical protein
MARRSENARAGFALRAKPVARCVLLAQAVWSATVAAPVERRKCQGMVRKTAPLILVALVAAIATPAEAARWSPPDRVPDSVGFGVPYDIAVNRGGRVAVAFPRGGIRVAVRRPHGGWEPTAEVSRTAAAVASPSLALDAHGRITVVWLEAGSLRPPFGAPFTIRSATRDVRGRWSRPVTLGTSNHFELAEPQLAINERGDVAVAWRGLRKEDPSGRTEAVLLAYRRAGHRSFRRARPIEEPLRPRKVYDHRIALDARGRVHIVWTTSEGPAVRYAVRQRDGRFGQIRTLSSPPASRPDLAVAGDGAVVVAWRAAELDSEGEGLHYGAPWAIVRRPSGAWARARRLSTVPIYSPLVATSAFGRALVAWAPPPNPDVTAGANLDLRFSARNRGGDLLPEREAVRVPAGAESFAPARRLGMLQDGTAVVVVARAGGIAATQLRWGGTFGPLVPLARSGDAPLVATAGRRLATVYTVDGGPDEGRWLSVLIRRVTR